MEDQDGEIRNKYIQAGQGHVFQYYDTLTDDEKKTLLDQLQSIPIEKLSSLLESAQKSSSSTTTTSTIKPFTGSVAHANTDIELMKESYNIGIDAISNGHVAALVLAGGQGTRLGYTGPKGMYDIGLPSHKTLFELISLRILKLSKLAKNKDTTDSVIIPFYIMTSPLNHNETVTYFQSNDYFGLGKDNVYFFCQGMLPCLNNDGKIIMEYKNKIAMAPDGNGGIYPSLQSSNALNDMEKRNIKYIHVFSIDNALVKPVDPIFIGYCIKQNADCGNKVVWKVHSNESVGVIAVRDDKPCIVEYSEITNEMAELTDDNNILVYGAANICNHYYTIDFIRNVILPNMNNLYHIANKKIPYYDHETNQTIIPTSKNNGIKLETFIFDVFPLSTNMTVLDVNRYEEFAPVKNKTGNDDSPETARIMISSLVKQWIINAGGKLVNNNNNNNNNENNICEISPLTSYAGEGLEDIVKGKDITCPFSL